MTKDDIKRMIVEIINEAPVKGDFGSSPEYELTPDEIELLKTMTPVQRGTYTQKKLRQTRLQQGLCAQCGKNPTIKKKNGTVGTYCQGCLDHFRVKRRSLAKQRGSCSRCPNPALPGKKLCQKCTDELQALRNKAAQSGLCLRCKKVPAEKNEKGEPTMFCRQCMKIKVAQNKQRKKFNKAWKDYGKDVIRSKKRFPTDPTDWTG